MLRHLLIPVAGFVLLAPAWAQEKFPTMGMLRSEDPRFDKLFPPGAQLEKLASGFAWTEGPVWIKDGGFLLFSDIPNNAVHKWQPGRRLTKDFIKPAGYTGSAPRTGEPGSNGLILDPKGKLILMEHGDRRVTRLDLGTKKKEVLADKHADKRLNSPNDAVFHSSGDLYFTDPPYGLEKRWEDPARELDHCGVYRLSKGGKLTLLTKEMTRPNGIAFSRDEKRLYVANSDPKKAVWMSFPVKADGTLGEGKVFFDATKWVGKRPGLPDGMKVDIEGRLWATGPGGVLVFMPDGTLLGRIDTGVPTANCAFGEDGSVLYVTADKNLCRIRTTTKGKGF